MIRHQFLVESWTAIFAALSIVISVSAMAQAPYIDPADDLKHLNSSGSILFWTPEQQVAGYRNAEKIFPSRRIPAGKSAYPLPYAKSDLGDVEIRYEGDVLTVDQYFVQKNVAGLLVIKDGKIVYERYGLGNTENSRWISFSVAKSVVSMLIGAAIQDGYIAGADESVTAYLPRLKGSPYDQSTIRDLLQMASGVQWNEDYADPESDVSQAAWETIALYEYLRDKPRESKPGQVFNYNTAETNLAGTLLRSAIGNNLATYLSDKIWQPFGMESDAYWMLTEPGGGEFGGCCISATLRDYGRIGMFALNNGRLPDGSQVLPDNWMEESTTPSKGYKGYGYFWWLPRVGEFAARGIFGQGIGINPKENVVIALHSARSVAFTPYDVGLQDALYVALTNTVRN